jgi:hypothetical protein
VTTWASRAADVQAHVSPSAIGPQVFAARPVAVVENIRIATTLIRGRAPRGLGSHTHLRVSTTIALLRAAVTIDHLDIDCYLKLLLAEKKLSGEEFQPVPKIEEKELDLNPLETVRVDSLKVGEGVNPNLDRVALRAVSGRRAMPSAPRARATLRQSPRWPARSRAPARSS